MTSLILTPALISSFQNHPALPRHSWYLIAGVALTALNRPHDLCIVFKHAIDPMNNASKDKAALHDDQLAIARRMREALLKMAPIGGWPKTITALLALKNATPLDLLDEPLSSSPSSRAEELSSVPSSRIIDRGQIFFDRIYGSVSKRVMDQLDQSGTEDLGLTARLMYGYVLSNTAVLNAVETSFALIAGLIPQDLNPLLKGHLRGALNNGATVEEAVVMVENEVGVDNVEDEADELEDVLIELLELVEDEELVLLELLEVVLLLLPKEVDVVLGALDVEDVVLEALELENLEDVVLDVLELEAVVLNMLELEAVVLGALEVDEIVLGMLELEDVELELDEVLLGMLEVGELEELVELEEADDVVGMLLDDVVNEVVDVEDEEVIDVTDDELLDGLELDGELVAAEEDEVVIIEAEEDNAEEESVVMVYIPTG
ncbi:MAG: hypothetical protein M1829_001162 [Trizodia sp. TS-e1964]|nr:MAG: hypothetical protein M1829_001162 [Trizodia sp. TS-e1964]